MLTSCWFLSSRLFLLESRSNQILFEGRRSSCLVGTLLHMHRNLSELTARVLVLTSVKQSPSFTATLPPTFPSTNPSLASRRQVSSRSQPRLVIMLVMLLLRLWSCLMKRAPLLWMFSRRSLSLVRYGSHTEHAYSSFDRTRARYASSRSSVGHPFRFLRRKPKVLLAVAQMVLICAFHCRSSLKVTPRYFEVGTLLRTHPQR